MSPSRPISPKGHIDKGARSGFARKEKAPMPLRSVLGPDLNFRGIPQAILQFHQNTILPSAMGQWIAFRSLNSSLSGGNYYTAYTYVNSKVSKPLEILKNIGLDKDTIIIFTGDTMASSPLLASLEVSEEPWEPFLAKIRAGKFDTMPKLRKTTTAEAARWGYNLDDKRHFEEQVKEAWTEFRQQGPSRNFWPKFISAGQPSYHRSYGDVTYLASAAYSER
ncbi:unnamed protein product [Penicillium pancosmium]